MKRAYFVLLAVIAVLIYLPLFTAPSPPALPTDGNGHLFKIHKLMSSGWEPWIEDWYSGFPFLRFYPPLSYLIGAFLGFILGSDIRGYAATLMLTSFVGATALHFYLRRSGREPYVAPLVFLLFPWHLGVAYIEANFPRANSINLFPLFILALLWAAEVRERYLAASAVAISVISLVHHSAMVPLVITGFVLLFENFKRTRVLSNFFKVGGIFVALTAFWYVPFFLERNWSNFWDIYRHLWLFRSYSVSPSYFLEPVGLASMLVFITSLLVAYFRGTLRRRTLALIALYLYLALGYYSPTPWIHSLPVFSMIPPYRWMDMINLLVPLLVADALTGVELKWRLIGGALAIGILIIGALPYAKPVSPYPQDLMEVAEFLREQPGNDWRFVVHPAVSPHSYLPVLADKDTLNGWYHEGDPAEKGHLRMWYLLSTGHDASLYLKAYAVKFLITSTNITPGDYSKLLKIGQYWVYASNVTFVEPVRAVLLGDFYDLPVDYAYLEDPSELAIIPPGTVGVVYAGNPSSKEVESLLWNFLEKGGTVVWVPDRAGCLLGICSLMGQINGSQLSSGAFNVSIFAPFEYEGMAWYGPVFENVAPIISAGDRVMVGMVKLGNGTLYLVGGNLLYHSLYWNSKKEAKLVFGLAETNGSLNYTLLSRSDGEYSLKISPSRPILVRISESYYPHWKIKVNGEPVEPIRDDRTGLTLITVSKMSTVNAEFHDPFMSLRVYSAIGWAIVIVYILLEFSWRRGSWPIIRRSDK
ncbi:6-pyruvoyl-tetrahydropterin synthase-related protein [Thermococcus stetteri]|uniref:6-pyruvoyl-tetrahydropterin synthase-related protein n=1 Tax=Thermococcus stetteri TaxID=49900 RepID=UPI001AE49D37|nr:6-pyruvoyl-tetrahydropterin synthase-related protein [Thermococcus stetteri]MBP1911857.1 putative membrane protein [Thermococcus stetteri]